MGPIFAMAVYFKLLHFVPLVTAIAGFFFICLIRMRINKQHQKKQHHDQIKNLNDKNNNNSVDFVAILISMGALNVSNNKKKKK